MQTSKTLNPIIASLAFFFALMTSANADNAKIGNTVANFELENGLEVVVIPDHRSPVVTHMLWYKVGSADEEPGKSGIAHFFEHLMFKATRNHEAGEFSRAIAEIGGQENAFTSYDYTAYFQQVSPDALPTMMAFEADRMRNLVLNDEVVAIERDVIIEERVSRVENDPNGLLDEEIRATIYQNHPYKHPVIGWMHEIRQLNLKDAVAFYDRYYVPNNAILVVAGDVDAETVRTLAEQTYGNIPRGPELPARVRPSEPRQDTQRTVTMRDERVSQPTFRMAWLVPSYANAESGEAEALDLLAEILGGGIRSRVYQKLVVEDRIAASAGAWYQGSSLDHTTFGIWGSPIGGTKLDQVKQAILVELGRIAEEGVSDDELEKAKNRFLKSVIFARDNQSSMARIYGASLAVGETVESIERWPDNIRAVKPQDIKSAAIRIRDTVGHVTGYLLPDAEETE